MGMPMRVAMATWPTAWTRPPGTYLPSCGTRRRSGAGSTGGASPGSSAAQADAEHRRAAVSATAANVTARSDGMTRP